MDSKRKSYGLPDNMSNGIESSNDPETICELFKNHFKQVYSPPIQFNETTFEYLSDLPGVGTFNLNISENSIKKELLKLDTNKGSGPDDL